MKQNNDRKLEFFNYQNGVFALLLKVIKKLSSKRVFQLPLEFFEHPARGNQKTPFWYSKNSNQKEFSNNQIGVFQLPEEFFNYLRSFSTTNTTHYISFLIHRASYIILNPSYIMHKTSSIFTQPSQIIHHTS